jgi:hypothetical protein
MDSSTRPLETVLCAPTVVALEHGHDKLLRPFQQFGESNVLSIHTAISPLINRVAFDASLHHRDYFSREGDSQNCRGKIKLIHLLVKHGARWVPKDTSEINDARKSLLKLIPDYTVEFVWIMAKYQACSQPVIAQLLRTPTITKHVVSFRERLAELTATLKSGA